MNEEDYELPDNEIHNKDSKSISKKLKRINRTKSPDKRELMKMEKSFSSEKKWKEIEENK